MSKEKTRSIRAPYINREYSWLQFDDRVLDQARDPENPLLERCRFLSIFISNLDEFVRVRLGSLMNLQLHSPDYTDNKSGMDAAEQIDMVLAMLPAYYRKADETFSRLRKELKKEVKDSIMMIVAQRVSTIMDADRIVVLDEGKVAGIGTHSELLKSCQIYHEIAASQLSEEELAYGK